MNLAGLSWAVSDADWQAGCEEINHTLHCAVLCSLVRSLPQADGGLQRVFEKSRLHFFPWKMTLHDLLREIGGIKYQMTARHFESTKWGY